MVYVLVVIVVIVVAVVEYSHARQAEGPELHADFLTVDW